MFKSLKPLFIENSIIPIILSKLAPIEIGAITLGFVVISRGEMDEVVRRHETIHFQQYLEMGFIGFVLVYLYDYFINRFVLKYEGEKAYYMIRAEREAYENEEDEDYLLNRPRWTWLKKSNDIDNDAKPMV